MSKVFRDLIFEFDVGQNLMVFLIEWVFIEAQFYRVLEIFFVFIVLIDGDVKAGSRIALAVLIET